MKLLLAQLLEDCPCKLGLFPCHNWHFLWQLLDTRQLHLHGWTQARYLHQPANIADVSMGNT